MLLNDPEPWPFPVRLEEVLEEVHRTLQRYVVLPDATATAITLWVAMTHSFNAFNVAPILAIVSPEKRCGKTTLLELLSVLVTKPLPAANVTDATIYRAVASCRPTLLIDEADTFLPRSEGLRGILNSGHRKSFAVVLRSVAVAGTHEVKGFSTWCPKAIATIGKLPETLQDRSIVAQLHRRCSDEPIEKLHYSKAMSELEPVRRKATRWAQDAHRELSVADPALPPGLDDRAADNWRPLLAIADSAGGDWPLQARMAAQELSGTRERDDESIRTTLLADVRQIFDEREIDRISSADLVAALAEMEDRPWPELHRGKAITVRDLAKLLRPFGIQPHTVRIGTATPKGYDLSQFREAFRRYLPAVDRNIRHVVESKDLSASAQPQHRLTVAGGRGE